MDIGPRKLKRISSEIAETGLHLGGGGWDVLQVWEHDMKKDLEKSLLRIERFLAE